MGYDAAIVHETEVERVSCGLVGQFVVNASVVVIVKILSKSGWNFGYDALGHIAASFL